MKNAMTLARAVAAAWLLVAPASMAVAELAAPQGEPILTVTGAISQTNDGDSAVFDLEMLEALPVTEFTTSTVWTEGAHVFTGVSMKVLLETLGAEGAVLHAQAINDYAIEIPASDAVEGGPIVAYRMDGNEMSVRNKGPLWVIYPYDSDPQKYQSEVIYSRSIWQLDRLRVAD